MPLLQRMAWAWSCNVSCSCHYFHRVMPSISIIGTNCQQLFVACKLRSLQTKSSPVSGERWGWQRNSGACRLPRNLGPKATDVRDEIKRTLSSFMLITEAQKRSSYTSMTLIWLSRSTVNLEQLVSDCYKKVAFGKFLIEKGMLLASMIFRKEHKMTILTVS